MKTGRYRGRYRFRTHTVRGHFPRCDCINLGVDTDNLTRSRNAESRARQRSFTLRLIDVRIARLLLASLPDVPL
jgi:hypothetical protein